MGNLLKFSAGIVVGFGLYSCLSIADPQADHSPQTRRPYSPEDHGGSRNHVQVASVARSVSPTFLKALSFALTGRDGVPIIVEDPGACVFRIDGQKQSGDPPTDSIEVFHLNNVDTRRLAFKQMKQTYPNGTESRFVEVELYGEDTVYEDRAIYAWQHLGPQFASTGTTSLTKTTLVIYTSEYTRFLRAWKYIYAHGCVGSKSSF